MGLGPYRSFFVRCDCSRCNRFTFPFGAFSSCSVSPWIRHFLHSLSRLKVASCLTLGGVGGDLRGNWISRLHAAANQTALRNSRWRFDLIFLFYSSPSE